MTKRPRLKRLDVNDFELGVRTDIYRALYQDAASTPVRVPFIVARGTRPGPVLGVTAAVHGNEHNGIRIIHHLLEDLDLERLSGSLVCVPVVNLPAYNAGTRNFPDGTDLNHVFPGKAGGTPAQQYARALESTLLPSLDYLVDIHTASEGRINTMYVRADMTDEVARRMALEFNPQIILHARGGDGTLRTAARRRGVTAITVEAGNPNVIQGAMVTEGETGLRRVMVTLGLMEVSREGEGRQPVLCHSSKWLRTVTGGLLETRFKLLQRVSKGQLLAITRDPFGNMVGDYHAPADGIVIGMSTNPAAVAGTRFCHLGNVGEVP